MDMEIITENTSIIKTTKDSNNFEWLRGKLKGLWSSANFCGICLENNEDLLCSVDMHLLIGHQSTSKSMLEILNYVFSENIENIMSSNHICDHCAEKAVQTYFFIYNTRQMHKIINNCATDLHSKVVDVDCQLEGDNCLDNANVMIVLEYDEDIYNFIEEIKSGNSIMPTVKQNTNAIDTLIVKKQEQSMEITSKKDAKPAGPKIIPTLRVEKNYKPRELIKAVPKDKESDCTPAITLIEGKLVVKPLSMNSDPPLPRYNTYNCNLCSDIFTTYRSLKEHEKATHNTVIYKCRFCNKTYTTQQYLSLHYKTHAKERCKICQEIFDEGTLTGHLRTCHEHVVYPCKFCELVYYNSEELETHFKASHLVNITQANGKEQCIMCLRNINKQEVKIHKCKFSCSECLVMPCLHFKYLSSYREQVLNRSARIKCIDCDYSCKRKEHLITHVNREHLDHHPFTCAECGTQFYTKLSLRTHITQYHEDLKCQYCCFDFKNLKTLVNHRQICKTVTRPYSCDKCVASFDTEEELTKHDYFSHSEIVYPCTLCKKEFVTEVDLEEHHAKVHSGIQVKKRRRFMECTLCDVNYRNLKELLQHEKTHAPDEKFPCKVCPKQLNSLRKLYIHKQRHYTERITCSGCKKNVAASTYPQHVARCDYNRGNMQYTCEICGKSYHLESSLRFHKKVHLEKIPCPHCYKMIKPTGLDRHITLRHRNREESKSSNKKAQQPTPKLLECEYCGHKMRKKNDVEAHMNRYHLKVKPFICHVCSKAFCGKARLKEHLNTHTDNNVCFCTVCGKKFANRVCLKMHLRRHTGENPYTCDICGDKFRSSSIMKTHRLKKHLEKSVACPLCDSMFHIVREMRYHVKNIHWKNKDKPFNPREITELGPEYYHLFEDRRLPKVDNDI